MLHKLTIIVVYALVARGLAMLIFPIVIRWLRSIKAGVTNRELSATGDSATIFHSLHKKKDGTPTMGGIVYMLIMAVMIGGSILLQYYGYINNSLLNQRETYIILFAFFSLGMLGLVDDYTKITKNTKINGLGAIIKLFIMIGFSIFIAYWFGSKLGVDFVNIWPLHYILGMNTSIVYLHIVVWDFSSIGLGVAQFSPIYVFLSFFFTLCIVNAINITDGLDGLVGGMGFQILTVLAVITFGLQLYLASTVVAILGAMYIAYLRYNISPAQIFMGDSGSLALGGLISAMVNLIAIKIGFVLPFMIMFAIFWIELGSSFLQIFWKKVIGRKLFAIAPFHHLLEHRGLPEHNIVMKFRVVQGILCIVCMVMIMYEIF